MLTCVLRVVAWFSCASEAFPDIIATEDKELPEVKQEITKVAIKLERQRCQRRQGVKGVEILLDYQGRIRWGCMLGVSRRGDMLLDHF